MLVLILLIKSNQRPYRFTTRSLRVIANLKEMHCCCKFISKIYEIYLFVRVKIQIKGTLLKPCLTTITIEKH